MNYRIYLDVYFANGGCRIGVCVDMCVWEDMLEEELDRWVKSAFPNEEIETYSWQVEWAKEEEERLFD